MAKTNTLESVVEVDATKSLIEKKIASGETFVVERYDSPRIIEVKGFNKPLNLVSILDYTSFVRQGQFIDKTPGLNDFAKEVQSQLKSILKPGSKIFLQTMPDSYYYDDKAIRAYNERDVDVIAFIGDKPLQEILVEKGLAIYNNSEAFRLADVYLARGEVDRTLAEVLKSAEIIAASKKQGFWQDKYSFYEFKSKVIGQLNKTFESNRELLEEKVKQINQAKLNRLKSNKSAEERKKEIIEQRKREKESFNRTYSNSSLGEKLSHLAKQYFPKQKSGDIISAIVAGIYPKSAMQIGALWSGIPTFEEEKNGLGAASHPVEIVEIRKDGDVKPILGQGFLSMIMGNRPPDEGLTLIFTCSTRGIETFIAPLITQFRMDPIVPIRNLHIARFARPLFSNREFYSKVFGKLPKDITDLVNPDGTYTIKDENSVRELSRLLDYMYLSIPIYIAVRRVQVNNLENNSGSYTVTVECQITDVSENFGEYPTYFSTIDDAFQVHEKRASVIDKVDSEAAIRHIAEQIGSGQLMDIYTEQVTRLESKNTSTLSKINYIKSSAMPSLFPSDTEGDYKSEDGEVEKNSKLVGYILKENKLVEVPATITIKEATEQARGTYNHKYSNAKNAKNKVGRFLSYKPAFGTSANWNLAKTLLGLTDLKFSDTETMNEVYRYFSLYKEAPSKIPIPISGSKRIRNGFVYKDDLTPTSQSLKTALKTEKQSLLDSRYISSYTDPIPGLLAVTSPNSLFSAYDYNFANYRKEALIGSGNFPIIKPFELCSVSNSSFGENTLANLMEFEYGIGIGLPSVKVEPISSNTLGISMFDETYSLVGNLKEVGQSLAVFSFGPDGILPTSFIPKSLIINLGYKKSYFPELNSTFSHSINSNLVDSSGKSNSESVSEVTGTLGSLKFNSSLYKTITSVKTEKGSISSADRTIQREVISQRYEMWRQERVDHIIGSLFKEPLKFEISLSTGTSIEKVSVGITNILRSQAGSLLFILQVQDKEKTILPLRTLKYQEVLVSLIAEYVEALPRKNNTNTNASTGTSTNTNTTVKRSLNDIKASIRNIIQSVVSKNNKDPLLDKSSPNVLTNITQVLGVTKSKIGTKFIDESEPYVFSLMYQLGRVDPGKFDMTFKIRPDRVPYVRPDFLLTDITTMEMEIFRPEAPKEESRVEAYTRELQRSEEAIRRTSTKEGLNSEVFQFALTSLSEIDRTINVSDIKSVQAAFKNPIYVLAGVQAVLLRYLDYVYSAHIISKAGQTLLRKNLKINNPNNRVSTGLSDISVSDLLKSIKEDIIQNKISKIQKKFKSVSDKNPSLESTNKIIEANIRSLLRIISDVESRISDAKNTKNEPFVSVENIRRMVRYAQIRGLGDIFLDTRSIIDELLRIYENTINLLLTPSKLTRLYTYKSGEIDLSRGDNSLANDILNLNGRLNGLLNITQAIRLASGDSLDFVKRKKLTLKKPIPSIGIVEEYGISSPIRAPGKKKATYQVVGSTATTAYVQFKTNISELYISETSKLSDLVNEEEGMDAVYNMIREPSDITTVYNMMRSGRALVRDATVFTQGSTTSTRSVAGFQSIENAFRLIRRASINSAQADAASVLVGLSEPHVQIKEPLLMALGLTRFVAKTTKLSSSTDTTSWKVDVFLLPYEAGYTTNRNLKRVNRAVSNEMMGDVASWLNAADSLFAERFIGAESKNLKDVISEKGKDYAFGYRRAEALIRITKMATSAVFSTMVAVHAMYKAKQKILRGLEPVNLLRPKDYEDVSSSFSNLTTSDIEKLAENSRVRSRNGLSDFDLKPSTFVSSVQYGGIGQVSNIAVGTFGGTGLIENTLATAAGVAGITSLGLGGLAFSSKPKVKAFGTKASGILAVADLVISLTTSFYQGFKNDELLTSSTNKFTESIKNNINVVIPLSQDFSLYALEFIEDFALAESKGQGQAFIELMAREAETVIQNAGDVSGLGLFAYANAPEGAEDLKAPTALGYIVSTYPISAAFKDFRSEEYFRNGSNEDSSFLVERISILVINANAFGKSGEVSATFLDDKWKRLHRDFYPVSNGDKSFFGSYVSCFSDQAGEQESKVLKTDVDTCGEELLSLLIDGQIAMYDTDIYSIALAPKYVLADVPFYYHGIRAIWGRLKVNHFATHLLSSSYASSISTRLLPISYVTSKDRLRVATVKSMEDIGINVVNFDLKKGKNYSQIKKFVDSLFKNKEGPIGTLVELFLNFPFANGRQIALKVLDAYESFRETKRSILEKTSSKQSNKQLYSSSQTFKDLKRNQASLSEIVRKIVQESPSEKRKLFKPAPIVFSIDSVVRGEGSGEEQRTSYVISPSSTAPSQTVSGENEEDSSLDNLNYLLGKVEKSIKEQITWILDSYTILLDGTTKADLTKSDTVSTLREAILTQLSVDRALQLGISVEQAKEEYKSEISRYFTSNGPGSTSLKKEIFSNETLQNIQKACDEITLYSDGNLSGRDIIFSEYSQFVSTFRQLMMLKPMIYSKSGDLTDIFRLDSSNRFHGEDVGGGFYSSVYKNKSRRSISVWDKTESEIFFSQTRGLPDDVVPKRLVTFLDLVSTSVEKVKAENKNLKYSTLSYMSFSSLDMLQLVRCAHLYFQLFYGIERPEFIPSVFYAIDYETRTDKGKIYGLSRTDISIEMLRSYSHGFSKTFWEKLNKSAYLFFVGRDATPFTVKAYGQIVLNALAAATAITFFAKGVLVFLIVFVVFVIIGFFLMYLNAPKVDSIEITSNFLSSLKAKIPYSGLSTSPMFTGMKALLEVASSISEMDLLPVGKYARSGKTLPAKTFRSDIYVYPPNIASSLYKSEYILQDTLSYLTVPLVTKRKATFVTDVLSPGGHIIPSVEKINENAKVLSTTALIQESFCRDELETLPEYLAIQKSKAQGISSDKAAFNILEPNDPSDINTGYFEGFKNFLDNIQGIYIGEVSNTILAGKPSLTISSNFMQKKNFTPEIESEIKHIHRYLSTELIPIFSSRSDRVGRKIPKDPMHLPEIRQIEDALIAYMKSFFDLDAYKLRPTFWSTPVYTGYWKELEILLGKVSSFAQQSLDKSDLAFAYYYNIKYFSEALYSNLSIDPDKDTSEKPLSKAIKNLEKPLISFGLVPEASAGDSVLGTIYSKCMGVPIVIEGVKRGTTNSILHFWGKADIAVIRESTASGRSSKRVESTASPNDCIFFTLSKHSNILGKSADDCGVAILKTKNLEGLNILSNRWNYIFASKLKKEECTALSRDGEALIRASEIIKKFILDSPNRVYMVFKLQDNLDHYFNFTEIYALKLAYERTASADDSVINVTWQDIADALKDIGCYLKFNSYVGIKTPTLEGFDSNTSVVYGRNNKAIQLKNATSTADLVHSSTVSAKNVNTVFAVTAGLTTQFVIDKINKYLDSQSGIIWENINRFSREIRILLCSPLRLYPVAKVYFIKKTKSETVLYDDIYSYADVFSIKIFESSKTPGTTAIIKLANTENKIDNVLAARSNSLNPFETRAKNEDELSGILIKPGLRILVYLGYGNILTEEEKFLFEVETSQQEPDGTYVIYCRGPGWVLNNRMNQSASREETGKIITVDWREVNKILPIASDTDIEIAESSNPRVSVAKSLLLYGLIEKGRLDRFGRLGSVTNELSETVLSSFPENITDSYGGLVQKGIAVSESKMGSAYKEWLKAAGENIKTAIAGVTFVPSSPELYLQKSAGGDSKVVRQTSIAKNIFPNAGFAVTTGIVDDFAMWMREKVPIVPESAGSKWRIVNESFIEFIQEAALNVPNVRCFVRSFNNDGSLIIGQTSEYYSMYTPKTLSSRLIDRLRSEIIGYRKSKIKKSDYLSSELISIQRGQIESYYGKSVEQLIAEGKTEIVIPASGAKVKLVELKVFSSDEGQVNQIQDIYGALYKIMKNSFSNDSAREAVAEIFTGAITAMIASDTDLDFISEILKNLDSGTSLNIISVGATAGAVDLYNQLRSLENISKLLDGIILIYADDPNGDRFQKEVKDVYLKTDFSGKGAESLLERLRILLIGVQRVISDSKSSLDLALDIGWSSKLDKETIVKAVEDKGSKGLIGDGDGVGNYGFFRRFVFCLTLSLARFFNNKLTKLEMLAPEKRKIQEQHYVFSGRDIIHNDITTMLGYNEGEFIFEKVSMVESSSDTINNTAGLFAKIEKFPFYIDPVSAYEGNTFDYVAKRLFVNLANPAFFSYVVNASGGNDSIMPNLTMMAANQMCKLIQDWYGGGLYTFGDASKRPGDIVHMTDEIRDMYGPFEIKESVYSFDIDGFTTNYSPSALASVDPRQITSQSQTSTAVAVFSAIMAAVVTVGAILARKRIINTIRAIPGVPKLLYKSSEALTKVGVGGSKWGGRLANAISKTIVTPLMSTTRYATRALKQRAKVFGTVSSSSVEVKATISQYSKSLGFNSVEELQAAIQKNLTAYEQFLKGAKSVVPEEEVAAFVSVYKQALSEFKGAKAEADAIKNIDDIISLIGKYKSELKDLNSIKIIQFREFICKSTSVAAKLVKESDGLFLLLKKPGMKEIISFGDALNSNSVPNILSVSKSFREVKDVISATYINQASEDLSDLSKCFAAGSFKTKSKVDKVKEAYDDLDNFTHQYFSKSNINNIPVKNALDEIGLKTQKIFEDAGPGNVERARNEVYKLYSKLRSAKVGDNVDGIVVTEDMYNFFRKQNEVLAKLSESLHGKLVSGVDDSLKELKNTLNKADFDPLVENPEIVKRLEEIAAERILEKQKELKVVEEARKKVIEKIKELEKKKPSTSEIEKEIKELKNTINNPKGEMETTISRIKEEIKSIEADKYSQASRNRLLDSYEVSKDSLNTASSKNFYKGEIEKEVNKMFDDVLFSRSLAIEKGADGTVKTVSKSVFTTTRTALFTPRAAFYSVQNLNPGKGLIGASFKALSIYSTFAYIRDKVGESIQEFALRVGAKEASDAVKVDFLVYKGEPYIANLEGLTKGSSSLIAEGSGYLDFLAARFSGLDRDLATIMNSIVGNTLRSNLTQYTDLVAKQTISDEFFTPFDSEYKFTTRASSDVVGDASVAGLNDKPSGFFDGPSFLRYAYGWRKLPSDIEFHEGVDIRGANSSTNGKESIMNSHKVYAVEDGIVFFNFFKGSFSSFDAALSKPNPYEGADKERLKKSAPVSITLIGLKTGLVFDYIHCYPLLEGQNFNEATQTANTSDVYYVGSGTKLGFHGPFGYTSGVHAHIDVYKSNDGPRNKFIVELTKALGSSPVGKVTSNAEVVKLIKSIAWAPERVVSKGFVKVDPEPIFKAIPIPGYSGPDKGVENRIKLQYQLRDLGVVNKSQKAQAVEFYKDKG